MNRPWLHLEMGQGDSFAKREHTKSYCSHFASVGICVGVGVGAVELEAVFKRRTWYFVAERRTLFRSTPFWRGGGRCCKAARFPGGGRISESETTYPVLQSMVQFWLRWASRVSKSSFSYPVLQSMCSFRVR